MITLLLALLVGCSGSGKDDTSGTGGDPTAGQAVYSTYCAACHGDDGKLGLETGGVASSDLTAEVPELSDDELHDVIMNGEGAMPAQTSDETEIADCIAYLRETFGAYGGGE